MEANGGKAMICNTCKYRTPIPGDCHISCGAAFDAKANPAAAVLAILGSVGRVPLPGPTKRVNFTPQTRHWTGCGKWPANYDESIVTSCEGYVVKGVV